VLLKFAMPTGESCVQFIAADTALCHQGD